MKLVLNPAYDIVKGKPDCNHKKERIRVGNKVYVFCEECSKVWVM